MKKLSLLLVLAMVATLFTFAASAEGEFTQSPWLDAKVESGELPPVEERLPENPASPHDMTSEDLDLEVGNYGGTLRTISSATDWSDDVFIGMTENLLTAESVNSGIYDANIVEEYEVSDDCKEFTFKLRKGLKWSDGVEVTMEDFEFCVNNFIFNAELTPTIAAYMRDAGSAGGDPFTFEVVDDTTFKIIFKESYAGFLAQISISGWKGYTDWLKPAHYLKPFHKDFAEECHGSLEAYYEFLKPFAAAIGYDDPEADGVWTYVFNQVDCTNWECSDSTDMLTTRTFEGCGLEGDFPNLYPWEMVDQQENYYYYERNPYYFKVDAAGQQLPYCDEMTYYFVESNDMLQLEIVAGNVDFMRAWATVDNIMLYRENEENAGIKVYLGYQHNHPCDLMVNVNYGMNVDGTVKEEVDCQAWQEAVNIQAFRDALAISIDAEEIAETVYLGLAEPQPEAGCVHDIEGANALLDEAGFADIDGDGWRETPSGLPLQWQIWVNSGTKDYVRVCELAVEYWHECGLNASVYGTESSLLSTSRDANEIPMTTLNMHGAILYFYQDWGFKCWCPLWNVWRDNGGMSGAIPEDSKDFLRPSDEAIEFFKLYDKVNAVSPEEAVSEVAPALVEFMGRTHWAIMHCTNIQKCVIAKDNVGNIPTNGLCIAFGFCMETMFFK